MKKTAKIIENEFYSFDVLQLVRVINEMMNGSNDIDDGNTGGYRIFFEADPSLAFPQCDVGAASINVGKKEASVILTVMNLLGSSSPLPVEYTDYIARNCPNAEAYRDFLSIAQNRLHTLWLYAHRDHADFFRLDVFARSTRCSSDLKLLLRSIWKDIPIRIEENIERLTLIDNRSAVGRGLRLGQNAAAGSKILDRSSKFRISLGPLDCDQYKSFLPDGRDHQRLQKLIAEFLNEPLICELELLCPQNELPPTQLGGGKLLGRTAALREPQAGKEKTHKYRRVIYG